MRIESLSIASLNGYNGHYIKLEITDRANRYSTTQHLIYQCTYYPDTSVFNILSPYTDTQLRVQRTRERVIVRILKAIKAECRYNLMHSDRLPTGVYTRQLRLSCAVTQRDVDYNVRHFSERTSNEEYRDPVNAMIDRSRAYGARSTRINPVSVKPALFKRLAQQCYHSRNMGREASECTEYNVKSFRMGVELELICCNPRSVEGDDTYLYRCDDGSLDDGGSEFVTRPDSMEVHVKKLGEFLAHNRFSTSSSCGMHVHVGRNVLTNGAISLIKAYMFNPNKKRFFQRYIAGRGETRYQSWDINQQHENKYSIINTRSSMSTIEFRWFSCTTNIHKIKRRLQWVNAICARAVRMSANTQTVQPEVTSGFVWPTRDSGDIE